MLLCNGVCMEHTDACKKPSTKVITTRISEALMQKIERLASSRRWSVSKTVAYVMERHLKEEVDETFA